jgi:hypothetical protein
VEIPTKSGAFRIGIEVKDESTPVDLPEIEGLIAKLNKLDIDRGCIVSRAGFTATAKDDAKRNGIELRTITEVESPSWWKVSTILSQHRQAEPLKSRLNYREEQLPDVKALLEGITPKDLELTLPSGESKTMEVFIKGLGVRALDRPDVAILADQDTFHVRFEFTGHTGVMLKCPQGPVPLPQSLDVLYRLHINSELVSITAYESYDDVNAFTGASSKLKEQLTLVTKLQTDGSRKVSFVWQKPSPPETVIPPRREKPDQNS